MALRRLGQILIDLGIIDEEQLEAMLAEQAARGGELLGRIGISMSMVTEEQLAEALAEQWSTTVAQLADRPLRGEVLEIVSEPMAQLYRIVPLELEGNRLTIASAEPQKIQVADELRVLLGYDIRVCVSTEPEIQKAIEKYYSSATDTVESIVDKLEGDKELEESRLHGLGNSLYDV
jgi:type IV pilus assembly protein PilB